MGITDVQPKLLLHYAPGGILVILKHNSCVGDDHRIIHGCDGATHTYTTVINVGVLQAGEEKWCLEQSWIKT
jgi:hypothetical protein